MSSIAWVMLGLFFPAGLGLIRGAIGIPISISSISSPDLAYQILAAATFLICLEQARMAVVDLENVTALQQRIDDPRLQRFYWVTVVTIGIELIGFYGASVWLGWGCLVVLLSQLWFNLLAGVQLQPTAEPPIQPHGADRGLVLVADLISAALIAAWMGAVAPLWMVMIQLSMVLTYGGVKYGGAIVECWQRDRSSQS